MSRRLERRIKAECKKESRWGYVKIAVHAYIYLLSKTPQDDVVLYAQELIKKDDSVVSIHF